MKNTTSSENGFTLLEVVIAVAIVTTGFFAVYSLHVQTLSAASDVRFYIKAPLLAQAKLAEIESNLSDRFEESGDFGEDFEGYTWKAAVHEVTHELLETVAERIKKIELQILLNEDENSYVVTAYRYEKPQEK